MQPTRVTIPDELKAETGQAGFGKILAATPVVMAVLSTMLAGLASSEMTRAQYDRSLAAQQQSKAGDQWSFFQAKRLRGAIQRNTADLMQSTVEVRRLEAAAFTAAAEELAKVQGTEEIKTQAGKLRSELVEVVTSGTGQQVISFMRKGELPPGGVVVQPPPNIAAALEAMDNLRSDSELATLLAKVSDRALSDALDAARDRALSFDAATKPINQTVDRLDTLTSQMTALVGLANASAAAANREFTAARLRYASLRYEIEARLNQAIANLYELQVRKSNISAERHHRRSQRFFYGMLGAQTGVILSTLAMAARKRNWLWAVAAVAGLLAFAFAVYVYLYV